MTVDAVVAELRAAGCVFAEDEAALLITAATSPAGLRQLVDRRVSGLPLEHILVDAAISARIVSSRVTCSIRYRRR